MEIRVIYVMTHDSIGLGEDGPTHQPVEHLASLRAIPGLLVFRPADAVETLECWELALRRVDRPSVLALTRQSLPCLRLGNTTANSCERGGYVLREASTTPVQAVLIATGSECAIAVEAHKALEAEGVSTRLVSLPCWELFDEERESYRDNLLGGCGTVRVAIEAASSLGWERYVGDNGTVIGMSTFGASGPIDELYRHFGITSEAVVAEVKRLLSG